MVIFRKTAKVIAASNVMGSPTVHILTVALISTMVAICAGNAQQHATTGVAEPAMSTAQISCTRLAQEIKREIDTSWPLWRIQTPETLSLSSRKRWEAEDPSQCPGWVPGQYRNQSEASVAVLLVARHAGHGYKLLVFTPRAGGGYSVETLGCGGSKKSDFFVAKTRLKKFAYKLRETNLRPDSTEGILLFDAGDDEYEVDLYYHTVHGFHHDPIDY